MDKVIIDGVDVSGCEYYSKKQQIYSATKPLCKMKDCCMLSDSVSLCLEKNCYYKQLKRLERQYENVLKIAKENADSNEYCLKELEQENERLKEESEHYRKEAYRLADGLNKTENLAFIYKQALQEIKDIVTEPCIVDENCQTCNSGCMQKDILAKINEVIGEE